MAATTSTRGAPSRQPTTSTSQHWAEQAMIRQYGDLSSSNRAYGAISSTRAYDAPTSSRAYNESASLPYSELHRGGGYESMPTTHVVDRAMSNREDATATVRVSALTAIQM